MSPTRKIVDKATKIKKKEDYISKLSNLFNEYTQILLVSIDNVGSYHIQQIRQSLRGMGIILLGKNTLIRKAIKSLLETRPELEELLPRIHGNVGFVFTKEELTTVRDKLIQLRVSAPAKIGIIAPSDVNIEPGLTGLEPTEVSYFQTLNIPTKIQKRQVEIISPCVLIHKGEKVGASEAALLQKLNIKPFTYGMNLECFYKDGIVFDAAVLDYTDEIIITSVLKGIHAVGTLSKSLEYPTIAAVPMIMKESFYSVLGLSKEIDYHFPLADKVFAAVPQGKVEAVIEDKKVEVKKEVVEEKKEEEEEEDFGGMGDLFG